MITEEPVDVLIKIEVLGASPTNFSTLPDKTSPISGITSDSAEFPNRWTCFSSLLTQETIQLADFPSALSFKFVKFSLCSHKGNN